MEHNFPFIAWPGRLCYHFFCSIVLPSSFRKGFSDRSPCSYFPYSPCSYFPYIFRNRCMVTNLIEIYYFLEKEELYSVWVVSCSNVWVAGVSIHYHSTLLMEVSNSSQLVGPHKYVPTRENLPHNILFRGKNYKKIPRKFSKWSSQANQKYGNLIIRKCKEKK